MLGNAANEKGVNGTQPFLLEAGPDMGRVRLVS